MKNDLVESVKSCFTSGVVTQLSTTVDETEPNTRKALNKSVPLVLKGLLTRVERGFAPEILLDLVRAADSAEVLRKLSNAQGTSWSEPGTNLLLDLLGESYRSTVNQITVAAGIRPAASGTLMQIVATAVLGVLGKVAVENKFTPVELTDWLRGQKDIIGSALLKDAIETALVPPAGAPALVERERQVSRQPAAPALHAAAPWPRPAPAEAAYAPEPRTGLRWQWGALLLLAVCLGYFFGRGYFAKTSPAGQNTSETAAARADASLSTGAATNAGGDRTARPAAAGAGGRPGPEPPTAMVPLAGRYDRTRDRFIYDTGRPITLTLTNGITQKVGANSTENRLYTFLSSEEQVDTVNRTKGWINFDRVNFETSRARLTPESGVQLDNVAQILKAFPGTVVKIGGYTDSTGDPELNYQLSEARARTTMLALARRGVAPARLQAKGYGPRYFVMDNKTPEGRSVNRRVSIRVVQK